MSPDASVDAAQLEHDYILQTYTRPELVFERGEGVYLYDTAGQPYLDFVAGIAVMALGHSDPDVSRAVVDQAGRLIHISNLYHSAPAGELARALVQSSPAFDRAFFCNSGAEAVEGAIKFARRYAHDHYDEGKHTVVAFDGSFHGRTMGAVAVTAREKYRTPFMPVMPGVRFAELNNLASLAETMADDVCAVIVEPVQGEGGLRVASDDFLRAARELCDKHNALLIFDEIQCGMGRTGALWAHEFAKVAPDMMTIAKPLAGGLPIGAVLLSQRVADAIHAGDHGTTFGGGPLVTTVAKVVFDKVSDPTFLARVRSMGDYLDEALHDLMADMPGRVLELRGRGLMRGIRIDGSAAEVRERAHAVNLLIATAGDDVLRLLPPLIITQQHVDEAIAKLRTVLD